MRNNKILIILMLIGELIFLLPFVVARIFRPTFLKVFEVSNFQLGSAFSLYGIIAMISYFLGGPIADRYSPRRLISFSLFLTALGGFYMAYIPSLFALTLLYGFWGLSTILLFWAASVRATREFGGLNTQGSAFGLVDGGRGLIAALLSSGAVFLFDAFLPFSADVATLQQLTQALSQIIVIFSGFIILASLLVWFSFPDEISTHTESGQKLSLVGVKEVIKKRSIWLQAIILLCAYVGYKCTDDFSLYASDVFGYNDVEAAYVGTISFWVRPIAALGAGLLGDRFQISRMVIICFAVMIIGSLVISLGLLKPGMEVFIALSIATTSAGIYGLRGLYYALFQESKLPLVYTGSAAGLVSVIGYTPDVFMGPLMGYILDSSPGAVGHQQLFLVLICFGFLGLLSTYFYRRGLSKISD